MLIVHSGWLYKYSGCRSANLGCTGAMERRLPPAAPPRTALRAALPLRAAEVYEDLRRGETDRAANGRLVAAWHGKSGGFRQVLGNAYP